MIDPEAARYAKPYPGAVGVYRLFDAERRLLYVGLGWSPRSRWRAHAKKADWWPRVADKTIEWFRTYHAASKAERVAILDENPIHNDVRADPSGLPELVDSGHDEMTIGEMRSNMTEVTNRVRILSWSVLLTNRSRPVAAVIPADLGLLIRRAGGVTQVAEMLREHLGDPDEDD